MYSLRGRKNEYIGEYMSEDEKPSHLVPKAKQAKRIREVRMAVLKFLYFERYTTVRVIRNLVGYTSYQGTNALLRKMEATGHIKRHRLTNLGGQGFSLWGITLKGCAAIYDREKMPFKRTRGFDTQKVYLATLDHLIETQLLKCRIINSDRHISLKYINPNLWEHTKPDILAKLNDGDGEYTLITYQIELYLKPDERYRDIIGDYIPNIKRGNCEFILWCTPDEKTKNKLSNLFSRNGASEHHNFRTIAELKL